MTGKRFAPPAGVWIDRSRTIGFTFNGRSYAGFEGDTLASALLANGVTLVGRSFKLHRPRGIFSCGVEEPTGLVDVGRGARRIPNVRATLLPIYEGLVAESVNCWPSLGLDLGALTNAFSGVLPAGFYYKTFKWPSWRLFEPAIRAMAGLGRGSLEHDPDRYEEVNVRADVLVIGGGIAGLSAAVRAARAGASTTLITSGRTLGGALGWRGDPAVADLAAQARDLEVNMRTSTMAFGVYDHNLVCACETLVPDGSELRSPSVLRERLWKIRARAVVAATGAFERPMVFPGNDRPGVMLAGAAEKYARAFGVACGRRVVVSANSDSAYPVASYLREQGVNVVAIVDRRPASLVGVPLPAGVRVIQGAAIAAVAGTRAVRGCKVIAVEGAQGRPEWLSCDALLSAGGHTPAVHLHSQAGGKLRWLDESAMFVPDGPAPGLTSVGACAGVFAREIVESHASETGEALARGLGAPPAPVGGAGRCLTMTHVPGVNGKQFVDLQNDVTLGDVALAARENYRSVEHLKRYTTIGMGTDQGKTSNINALVSMGEYTGRAPPEVGTTRFRPPFTPVTIGLYAGRRVGELYRPLKRLPAHAWHEARGALFENFGDWCRPVAYPRDGETLEMAAQREAATVRRNAGLFDGSPLGKLEIFGPDAARFLDLMYVGTMSTLAVGQARYGIVLNENGIIVDDGIVARMGDHRYWVNTTSAGVERTAAAFEEWLQCEYTQFQVAVTPVTSRWANVTVAGPRAWEWLLAVGFDAALAPSSMKHMSFRESMFGGVPLRILRASFSGELSYEINLPAGREVALFERLWARAAEFGADLYGIEALQIMRVEKGYIHIGIDTDGTTLPGDIGFGRGLERKAAEFVGRRSLLRPAARDPDRLQLVGLVPTDGRTLLPVGAQIAPGPPPTRTHGHVTSSYRSPELGKPVALAMLARGAHRIGERIRAYHLGTMFEAEVVPLPFLDPAGKRVHG